MVDAVMGVDPGSRGAVSILTRGRRLTIIRFDRKSPKQVFEELWAWRTAYDCKAWLEFQGPRKCDHGHMVSFAALMKNYGIAQGLLHSAGIPFELIDPTKWQLEFGLGGKQYKPGKGDKPWNRVDEYKARKENQAIKANLIFPGENIAEPPADAVLLAEYGWRSTFGRMLREKRNF